MAEETLNFTGGKRMNIRTMKSDISAFLKETKPSLVQLISTQTESERLPDHEGARHRLNAVLIGIICIVFAAVSGFLLWQKYHGRVDPVPRTAAIPQPFFSVETSAAVEYRPGTAPTLREKIRMASVEPEKTGVIKRIVAIDAGGQELRALDGQKLLEAAGIIMPDEALTSLTGPVMIVAHKAELGTRMGVVIKTSDAVRMFEHLLRSEAGAFRNWPGLFLTDLARPREAVFVDRDFRNIGYRDMTIDEAQDFHIIYGVFPAKNYLILSASRQTFQEIVNRLYEGS